MRALRIQFAVAALLCSATISWSKEKPNTAEAIVAHLKSKGAHVDVIDELALHKRLSIEISPISLDDGPCWSGGDNELKLLANLNDIQELRFWGDFDDAAFAKIIQGNRNITTLVLTGRGIALNTLKAISELEQLKVLKIISRDRLDWRTLSGCTALVQFELFAGFNTPLSPQLLESLFQINTLETVVLGGKSIDCSAVRMVRPRNRIMHLQVVTATALGEEDIVSLLNAGPFIRELKIRPACSDEIKMSILKAMGKREFAFK